MLRIIFVFFLFILCGCTRVIEAHDSNDALAVEVALKHPHADEAILHLRYVDVDYALPMEKMENHRFRTDVSALLEDEETNSIQLNIELKSNEHPGNSLWVVKEVGIDADFLTFNNVIMDNRYIISMETLPYAAIEIELSKAKSEKYIFGETDSLTDANVSKIPPELPQPYTYCRYRLPPDGFEVVLPWFHAMVLESENITESILRVKAIDVFAVTEKGEKLIYSEVYNGIHDEIIYEAGSRYLRHPFFYDESRNNWPMKVSGDGQSLAIYLSDNPDQVYHFWTRKRIALPGSVSAIKVEAVVRMEGEACLQLGLDYWRNTTVEYEGLDVNNTEAAISDVYFSKDLEQWTTISLTTESQ